MCRNIKTLFNFDPPASGQDIREASLQFVRKLSGFTKPSKSNEAVFHRAVDQTAAVARELLDSLVRMLVGVVSTEVFTYLHLEKQSYAWGAR